MVLMRSLKRLLKRPSTVPALALGMISLTTCSGAAQKPTLEPSSMNFRSSSSGSRILRIRDAKLVPDGDRRCDYGYVADISYLRTLPDGTFEYAVQPVGNGTCEHLFETEDGRTLRFHVRVGSP
ncbi:MAG TPA: hypothetical protein VGF18_09620 [Candidatus Tumulicola sp.]